MCAIFCKTSAVELKARGNTTIRDTAKQRKGNVFKLAEQEMDFVTHHQAIA